uniref:28S ribosomal protein S23, mitochondrial-like n=1 Tax=Phallusia mammillata TaxID=59560 RepID=A0A6F9DLD8_9ASCI|nr:28S ribosomal protein S23, mitochondrial-like [Phallusia mammillata]
MSKGIGVRLHRYANIYLRTKSLLLSGMLKHEKRPLWYDVYEAFPPVKEPKYVPDPSPDNFGLNTFVDDVPKIFYHEDWVRAMLVKNRLEESDYFRKNRLLSMLEDETLVASFSQKFVAQYRAFEQTFKSLSKEELFQKTHDFFLQEVPELNQTDDDS